jgi:hypothetical protein
MAFTEGQKREAKRRSAYRCCICHQPFVEVHHILPEAEHGPDSLENAAPVCARCHDLYGGNPEKRKQIREMRDQWWALMEERAQTLTFGDLDDAAIVEPDGDASGRLRGPIAIYHSIFAGEDFEVSAKTLWTLVANAQERMPGRPRWLFLDIEGHRNSEGGFDHDMWELQRNFVLGGLCRYLKKAYMPLIAVENPKAQRNDVPKQVNILPASERLEAAIKSASEMEIFVGDADRWIVVQDHRR